MDGVSINSKVITQKKIQLLILGLPIVPLLPYTISAIVTNNALVFIIIEFKKFLNKNFFFFRTCQWLRTDSDSNTELFIDIPIYIVLAVSNSNYFNGINKILKVFNK